MGRIAKLSLSPSFAFLFIIMLSLILPMALARSHLASHSDPHDLPSAAKQVRTWPCCDSCGACIETLPLRCQCLDLLPSCPSTCRRCIEEDKDPALSADPSRKYRCLDFITNLCEQTCTSTSIINQ
ncbi:hypothetical protein LUZ63_011305 [Rhynchospora breviuscula]|uniref:Bowman-Birk serine protease inhibitors family domain-containing protein n=1 Tax=Rhynchospora breviuscula TaxID=2022672 RepID=A0A9Q0CIG9_9POAL|nr:hypothetical protein LUZ63_011305 [Rhynchospora breviuscula]